MINANLTPLVVKGLMNYHLIVFNEVTQHSFLTFQDSTLLLADCLNVSETMSSYSK